MFLTGGTPIVFLGGSDAAVEGEWRWYDGTLFWNSGPVGNLYTNWAAAPQVGGVSDCAGMRIDGLWIDAACSAGNATVACETP